MEPAGTSISFYCNNYGGDLILSIFLKMIGYIHKRYKRSGVKVLFKGIGVSPGIAIGRVHILADEKYSISQDRVDDGVEELKHLQASLKRSREQIQQLYNKAANDLGEEKAEIFKAHEAILQDKAYLKEIENLILQEKFNAPYAVSKVSQKYIDVLRAMDDPNLRERAFDIKDISTRVIRNLLGIYADTVSLNDDVIIVTKDLTPSDTAALDKQHVLGFITEEGGATSHTAIIARTLEIPAVVGLQDFNDLHDGDIVLLDGEQGEVYRNPGEQLKAEYRAKKERLDQARCRYLQFRGWGTLTADQKKVALGANIGCLEDLELALQNGAEEIGLFRTELFYLGRSSLPTEEEQFQTYRALATKMERKPVLIRTLDVGGDKNIPYMNLPAELNPFLGYRAIRVSLDQSEMFETQLRAILRASVYGKIKILLPMISSMRELLSAKEHIENAKRALRENDIPFDQTIETGIMIEVPAAAMISDLLAKEVDFFSIGTNDLIQYATAVDRGNKKVSHLYNVFNPGVLRLIQLTVRNARTAGIDVGMCGEAASDARLIPLLLAMGLNKFSMNAAMIPQVRCLISGVDTQVAEPLLQLLDHAMAEEIIDALEKYMNRT